MDIVTYSNRKLGGLIGQINMPKGISCRKNAPCAILCYGNKGNIATPNAKKGHMARYQLYLEKALLFFQMIVMELTFRPCKLVRWHAMGDIVDFDYFKGMVYVALQLPDIKFLAFTKKYEIVNEYIRRANDGEFEQIPENLVIVFSAWGNWIPDNPHNLPVSYVEFGAECDKNIPSDAKKCMNQEDKHLTCAECFDAKVSCWNLKHGESVVFKKH